MNKLKTVKWGFIGCGEVTEKKSGPAFAMIEDSQVVAVMSRNKEKAESYAKRHNIPRWYTDVQQLIGDEDVNAVYIATPPSSHATFAIMAMKAGKPVYIEKPMAASYEDCARINRISQETGVPCFVAYYRRYLPYFQKVRQMVENGEIGNVINIQIRFAQPPRNLDITVQTFLGAYRRTLREAVIFTTLPLINWIYYKICSAAYLKQKDIKVTEVVCIRQKTPSVPVSNLIPVCPVPAHGALWHMNLPKKTASKSLVTKE